MFLTENAAFLPVAYLFAMLTLFRPPCLTPEGGRSLLEVLFHIVFLSSQWAAWILTFPVWFYAEAFSISLLFYPVSILGCGLVYTYMYRPNKPSRLTDKGILLLSGPAGWYYLFSLSRTRKDVTP